jgi:hypothetical protein
LLLLSDIDVMTHAEDGIAFFVDIGQLSLLTLRKTMLGDRQWKGSLE